MATREGAIEDSPERPTIREIASRSGVSVATVSRVLNGRPDVASTTREVVMRHVREGAYVTNRSARGLAGGRTGLIGLTIPYINAEYFMEIMDGAAQALYEHDARLIVCPTEHEYDREVSLLDRVTHGTTDGAILVLPSESSRELAQLARRRYPFVVVDPAGPLSEDIPVVASSHWSGARAMTEYLLGLGHRRIAIIGGKPNMVANNDRLAGYHSALAAAGIAPDPKLVARGDWNMESGYAATRYLLDLAEPPSAIFALNDNMAIAAIDAARQRGLDVPVDISIAGYDDTALARVTQPKLTTVRQSLMEMGRVAVSVLYRLLDGQSLEATRIELSTRLVVRESTAEPPV